MTMDTREAVARALCRLQWKDSVVQDDLDKVVDSMWDDYTQEADAAIAAHLKALADAGYAVVPREPDEAMVHNGTVAVCCTGIGAGTYAEGLCTAPRCDCYEKIGKPSLVNGYRAMIAASPQPVADHPADQRGGE